MVNYQELQNTLPTSMLGRVMISGDSLEVDQTAEDVMDALRLIEPLLIWKECRTVGIFLGTERPFRVPAGLGVTWFDIPEATLHAAIDGVILIDCNAAKFVASKDIRIAAILEELVHAFMHVHCETFVKHVVTLIIPRVAFRNGRYVAEPQNPHSDFRERP